MKRKKKDTGMAGAALGMVAGGATLGIGAQVITQVGGPTAGYAGAGMTTMASFMPAMGSAYGAGLTVQQLKKLQKQSKRR